MNEEKSANLLSSDPQADNMPDGDDDTVGDGGERQFLMNAWQNLAMYIAATDEPECAAVGMMLLQGLRQLISGENLADVLAGPGQPQPDPMQQQVQQQQDPNAAPQPLSQTQPATKMQTTQSPAPTQTTVPSQTQSTPAQPSPFGTPPQQQPLGAPQGRRPSGFGGGNSSPKKKTPAKKSTPSKKSTFPPKKKKSATAMAALEWLESAATTYDCPTCDRNFGSEAGLIAHLKAIHQPGGNQPMKAKNEDAIKPVKATGKPLKKES